MNLKNIISTGGTRLLNAVFSIFILILITNFIGNEGLGIISIVIVDITVIQLFNDLVGGSPLVYFGSRKSISGLLTVSYLWLIFISLFTVGIYLVFQLFFPEFIKLIVPEGYFLWIIIISIANGFMQIHYNLLMGLNKVKTYNLIYFIQIILLMALFLYFLLFFHQYNPLSYFLSLGISWTISGVIGITIISKNLKAERKEPLETVVRDLINFGVFSQIANLLHLGSKRMSYYFIRYFSGLSILGIFSAGVQATEGLKIFGQSISIVQYSDISSSRDYEHARVLTIQFMKMSFLLTLSGLIILLAIPQTFYVTIFGKEFIGIKSVFWALSPGVLALSQNTIFSHYFSGTGRPQVNLKTNLIGFISAIVFSFALIPIWGIVGAGLTASGSYILSLVYQYYLFKKCTRTKLKEWLPNIEDLKIIKTFLKGKKK